MGKLVVDEVLFDGGGMTPLVGGERVRLLPLVVVVVVVVEVLLLSRLFRFGLRLDPKETPNCFNREFIRTFAFASVEYEDDCLSKVTEVRK